MTDKRLSGNAASAVALLSLLKEFASDPSGSASSLLTTDALRSQGSLAKFSLASRGIQASSLNTLKRVSDRVLGGGFAELDSARTLALKLLTSGAGASSSDQSRTKKGLEKTVKEQDETIKLLEQDLWHLSTAFYAAMQYARAYAKAANSPQVLARYRVEEAELRARVSMVRRQLGVVKGALDAGEDSTL